MNVSSFLALKFLSGKSRSLLTSFLSWMTVAGVMVSVAAFIVVEAVVAGFGGDLRSKVLGFTSHLSITAKPGETIDEVTLRSIERQPGVERATRLAEGEAIIRTEDGETQGVRIRGLNSGHFPKPEDLRVSFEEGENWESLEAKGEALPGILLGTELNSSLGVLPILAEEVELLFPLGDVGPTGEVEPNIRKYRVIGKFKSGYFEYDHKYAIVDLEEARRLFGETLSEQIGVMIDRPFQAGEKKSGFQKLANRFRVQTWEELHERLFSALKLERLGMAMVLTLMVLLASFNILSMLMMLVFERRKDVAVLKALGLGDTRISGIFFRAGFLISGFGGILGCLLGILICLLLSQASLSLPAPYYVETLPVRINPGVLAGAFLLAIALGFAATVLPAKEGRRMTIVEAIHYE